MNREQLEEQAALHALGLLEGEERRAFEQELERNPEAQALLATALDTASNLALTVDQLQPPPTLRARVLAALPERTAQVETVRPGDSRSTSANTVPFRWVPWALAAGLAVAAGVLLQSNLTIRREFARIESEREAVRAELTAAVLKNSTIESELASLTRTRQLDRLQIATLQAQVGTAPDASAVCAWDPETQQGILRVVNLPPPPADKDYQLWIVDPQYPVPVDGGVFTTAENGEIRYPFHPNQDVAEISLFAVSLEQKGGVPVSAGNSMVLVGK